MREFFAVLLFIIALGIVIPGCVFKNYTCPDLSKLQYFDPTDTYRDWISCKPPTPCNPDYKYEKWVNKNCGINYKIMIAH